MLVRARFFGDLKSYIKKSRMIIELPEGSTIHDFLFQLAKNKDPTLLKKLINGEDRPPSEITILVNGRNITHLRGLKTELKDRDVISTLPIAGGGRGTITE